MSEKLTPKPINQEEEQVKKEPKPSFYAGIILALGGIVIFTLNRGELEGIVRPGLGFSILAVGIVAMIFGWVRFQASGSKKDVKTYSAFRLLLNIGLSAILLGLVVSVAQTANLILGIGLIVIGVGMMIHSWVFQ